MKLEKKYRSLESIIKKHINVDAFAITTCFSLLSAGNKIDKACADRLAIYGLSESRFMILTLLFEYQLLSPLDIATLTGVTKPTITSLITALEKDGLIKKSKDSLDGRKLDITLTEHGQTLIQQVFHEHSHWIAATTQNLTPKDMQTLVQLLDKMFHKTYEEPINEAQ